MQVINQQLDKKINHVIYGGIGVLLGTTVLSGFGLCFSNVLATAGTASDGLSRTATVNVSASCSMTANPDGTDTVHTADLPNGTWSGGSDYYPNGIGKTTIATFCNDASGYSIYAVGFTGDSMSGNNTVLHSSTLGTNYDITTDIYEPGDTSSSWSMKVTKVTDSSTYLPANLTIQNSFDSYHAVPSTYTEVARFSSATDVSLGSRIETTYGAYVSGNQPAGSYAGKVKYTLVHPGGTDVPTVDTMQNVAEWGGRVGVGETVTATDSRDGNTYKVTGICTEFNATNPNNCDHYELWMTENLDLALSVNGAISTDGETTTALTSENTDLNEYGTGNLTPAYGYTCSNSDPNCTSGIITWTPGATLATPATISDFSHSGSATTVVSNWVNDSYTPHWAEGRLNGNINNEVYLNGSNIYATLAQCVASNTPDQCAHWHIGNYYNWSAAVATNNTNIDAHKTQYTTMPNSICPAGWHLPKGLTGSDPSDDSNLSDFNTALYANGMTGDGGNPAGKDFAGNVNVKYSSTGWDKMISNPFYFVRSGAVSGTTLYNSTGYGYYWSSTVATSGTNAYALNFASSVLYPSLAGNRYYGFSVRCVAPVPTNS
ncbi:hypothetical protein IKG05_00975 [Candidatus Saccharibacteria bacterium]|nr:hypothetical protein [Candidatus Saccharibacteria bacterium]